MLDLLLKELTQAGIPVDVLSLTAAGVVEIVYGTAATPEQRTQGDAIVAGYDAPLRMAQAQRLSDLNTWYTEATRVPVTVSGVTLPVTPEDQVSYLKAAVMQLIALALGMQTLAGPMTLYDANGAEIAAMTVADAFGLLLQYAGTPATLAAQYSTTKAAILAAATPEAVNAIVLPALPSPTPA